MKYLNKYKVFESMVNGKSTKEEVDDIKSVLNDMVLDIKDKDLSVEVYLGLVGTMKTRY